MQESPLMSDCGTVAFLQVSFDLNNDVILDDDRGNYFIANIYVGDEWEPQEFRTPIKGALGAGCAFKPTLNFSRNFKKPSQP
tara:strand:- start:234 stop:479 length:246 start_codon:yes stop_codon:yes gene_type:complete